MKQFSTHLKTWAAIAVIFAAIFFTPFNALAENGQQLVATITAYGTGGGTGGALQAVWDAETSTVTITNATPITGASETLTLDIGQGVRVIWKADIQGGGNSSLIDVMGDFEVAEGKIEYWGNQTIYVHGDNSNVTVNGGKVLCIGNQLSYSATICAGGDNCKVIVNDGELTGFSSGMGILIANSTCSAYVNGGTIIGNIGIESYSGDIVISGGTVHTDGGPATIRLLTSNLSRTVKISGGTVSSINSVVLQTEYMLGSYTQARNVTFIVSGDAVVKSVTGAAIATSGHVRIEGGHVSTETGAAAIYVWNKGNTITVTGGEVSAATGIAIRMQGDEDFAYIYGGTVSTAAGVAVHAEGKNNVVFVNSAAKVNATTVGGSRFIIDGADALLVERTGASTEYPMDSSIELDVTPDEPQAEAIWNTWMSGEEAQQGICCRRNSNMVYIPVEDVTVLPEKAISVRKQKGMLTAGAAGSVTFAVGTVKIDDGAYLVTLNGAPAGVTADASLVIDDNTGGVLILKGGELTIRTTAATPSGTYPLTITIDGVESEVFYLSVGAPVPAFVTTINTYGTGGGTGGALQATWDGVALTATVTNAGNTPINNAAANLTLNVDDGITVLWKASLTGTTTGSGNGLVHITGGNFEIFDGRIEQRSNVADNYAIHASGANCKVSVMKGSVVALYSRAISSTGANNAVIVGGSGYVGTRSGRAIYAYAEVAGATNTVTVSGNGEVAATDDDNVYGMAITTDANVTITGGTVSATRGRAINNNGANSVITVSGGTVSAFAGMAIVTYGKSVIVNGGTVSVTSSVKDGSSGWGISALAENCEITVSGGKVDAYYVGIYAEKKSLITVSNVGEVNSDLGLAIASAGNVNITGGKVSAPQDWVIDVWGDNSAVTVSGGVVSTDTGTAIAIEDDNNSVTVSGGTVSATSGGWGIYAMGASSKITVSGGTVSTVTGTGIVAEGANSVVTISSNGAVMATNTVLNADGWGIRSAGNINITGGAVSATGGRAIYAQGANGMVTVSGGTVNATRGVAIYVDGAGKLVFINGGTVSSGSSRLMITDANALSIERTDHSTVYPAGLSVGLDVQPEGATAVWAIEGGQHGIRYTRNTNTGFLQVEGVTVTGVTIYAVSVSSSGTGKTGDGNYEAGATVSINAGTPPTNQQFKNWTATSAGVTFANANSAATTFVMPANTVSVTANFETTGTTPTVISVTVSPNTATVTKGSKQSFTASVTGTGNPAQTVEWKVTGGIAGTTIAATGELSVATNETATTLTVMATSTVDNSKSGTATVTVTITLSPGTGVVEGKVTNAPAGTTIQLYVLESSLKSGVPSGYTLVAITQTDANGNYRFENLPEGTYMVMAVIAGYDSTPSAPVTLTNGQKADNINFTVKGNTITPDGVTGFEEIPTANPLKAWMRNGLLHVIGLTAGEPLSVYTATGALVYQNIVSSDEADIPLAVQGVYIVKQGEHTMKVPFN